MTLRSCLAVFVAVAAAVPTAFAAPARAEVVVNIDMTPDGKKVPRPTAEHPAYYVPVILGYHTNGQIIAGERPPSRAELIRDMGKALAKEGYVLQALRPDNKTTLPSLILCFEWGYLNPQISDLGEDPTVIGADSSTTIPRVVADFNQREMLTLVAGDAIYRGASFSTSDWERLRDAATEGRYYIIVSAYDFEASLKGEKKLLWRARMSTERQGVWMNDVVPALIAGGAPIFGRELPRPQFLSAAIRDGKVEIGTPTVVEDKPAAPRAK